MDIIDLDVGGTIFSTTRKTLNRIEGTYFSAIFDGTNEHVVKIEENLYFIDRSNTYFRYILNFLRDLILPICNDMSYCKAILEDAKFYKLDSLISILNSHIEKIESSVSGILTENYQLLNISEINQEMLNPSTSGNTRLISIANNVFIAETIRIHELIKDPRLLLLKTEIKVDILPFVFIDDSTFLHIIGANHVFIKSCSLTSRMFPVIDEEVKVLYLSDKENDIEVWNEELEETHASFLIGTNYLESKESDSEFSSIKDEKQTEQENKLILEVDSSDQTYWGKIKRLIKEETTRRISRSSSFYIPNTIYVPTRALTSIYRPNKSSK
eukprot:TRINITY_DN924_c0_g1_i1.p1 TRINITY_DN924_c0_g1~~TRINITY_DN924_c0_g1_i1.p1  ORF type:complete len:327 (-),score=92.18 TRINITY_DN924_c0_g1_i1:6-986(-)